MSASFVTFGLHVRHLAAALTAGVSSVSTPSRQFSQTLAPDIEDGTA